MTSRLAVAVARRAPGSAPAYLPILLLVATGLACVTGRTQDEVTQPRIDGWESRVALGVVRWPELGNLRDTSGAGFDATGFSIEAGFHKQRTTGGAQNVLLGIDFGMFTTDSDIPGVIEDLTQRGLYLTPSLRYRFGDRRKAYFDLTAGAGLYGVDFAELICNPGCLELDDPFEEYTFGGYLGASAGMGRWFVADFRTHFADFGPVTGIPSLSGELSGPVYTLSLGATF